MKHIRNIIVICLIISFVLSFFPILPVIRAASTYYVSTTGSDATGDGSIGNPWATIQKALNETGDGDTVYVRGGNYNDIYSPTQGLKLHHDDFILSGYQDEVAVINGNGYTISSGYGLITIGTCSASYNCDNVTIANLVIENSSRIGIKISSCGSGYSDNITISNCTINNISYRGINAWSSDSFTHSINNIEVKDCWINNTQTSVSMGEGVTFRGCQNVSVHDNIFSSCPKIMLDPANNTKNSVIYNNTFILDLGTGIKLDGSQSLNPSFPCYDSNISIYNNLFYGTHQHAITISAEKYGGCDNISIYNNIINLSNDSGAINAIKLSYVTGYGSTLDNISVTYNTIYVENSSNPTTGVCLQIEIPQDYATNFTIANNIFISSEDTGRQVTSSKSNFSDSYLHFHNNTYNHTSKSPDTYWLDGTYLFESSAINASPEFVDIGAYDFHLNDTSPCINKATSNYTVDVDFDGNTRPQGSGYDVGAYEYLNNVPTQSGEVPNNSSTGISLNPRLVINASDADGDWLNITFRTNATGSWGDIGTNTTHGSHWVNQTNSSFDVYSTKYYWSLNLTDGTDWSNATYHFTTITNTVPIQSGEVPNNSSTGISLNPRLVINASDADGDWLNITFRTNATGSWGDIGTNTTHGSHWVNQTNSSFDVYSTKYYWSLNLTDGTDWSNATYHFTINQPPNIPSPLPANNSKVSSLSLLKALVSDPDGDTMNVSFYWYDGTLINTSYNNTNNSYATVSVAVKTDARYRWYVIVNDSIATTRGPPNGNWSFYVKEEEEAPPEEEEEEKKKPPIAKIPDSIWFLGFVFSIVTIIGVSSVLYYRKEDWLPFKPK